MESKKKKFSIINRGLIIVMTIIITQLYDMNAIP